MIDVHLGRQPPLAEIPAGANVDDAKHAYSYIFIVVAVFCSGSDMFIGVCAKPDLLIRCKLTYPTI